MAVAVTALLAAGGARATEWRADQSIEDALSAAPPSIARTATVMDWNKQHVLRRGSGDYVCLPTPEDKRSKGREPMCLDTVWMAWLDAWMHAKPFTATGIGIAYMLAGDAGASADDPYASGPTADNHWSVDGPHLMIIVPDATKLDGLPTDADSGGPYVMWKGTPYVHIMVPIAERLQR